MIIIQIERVERGKDNLVLVGSKEEYGRKEDFLFQTKKDMIEEDDW